MPHDTHDSHDSHDSHDAPDETDGAAATAAAAAAVPSAPAPPARRPTLLNVPGGNADQDANLRKAGREYLPIRLRLQPTVLISGSYQPLMGVRWIMDLPSEDLAREFYQEMDVWIKGWFAERQDGQR